MCRWTSDDVFVWKIIVYDLPAIIVFVAYLVTNALLL